MKMNSTLKIKNFFYRINYSFTDLQLLKVSLTHSSFHEKKNNINYQRLEFLGDRVLGLVIADLLFEKFPEEKEGELSKRFSDLVNKKTLVHIANLIELEQLIIVAKELDDPFQITDSMLADSTEAIIGAIFLDSNYNNVKKVIKLLWNSKIEDQKIPPENPKSFLQEWCLKNKRELPIYKIVKKEGPDHSPKFIVEVKVKNYAKVSESGNSIREAEIVAAKRILEKLKSENR